MDPKKSKGGNQRTPAQVVCITKKGPKVATFHALKNISQHPDAIEFR